MHNQGWKNGLVIGLALATVACVSVRFGGWHLSMLSYSSKDTQSLSFEHPDFITYRKEMKNGREITVQFGGLEPLERVIARVQQGLRRAEDQIHADAGSFSLGVRDQSCALVTLISHLAEFVPRMTAAPNSPRVYKSRLSEAGAHSLLTTLSQSRPKSAGLAAAATNSTNHLANYTSSTISAPTFTNATNRLARSNPANASSAKPDVAPKIERLRRLMARVLSQTNLMRALIHHRVGVPAKTLNATLAFRDEMDKFCQHTEYTPFQTASPSISGLTSSPTEAARVIMYRY